MERTQFKQSRTRFGFRRTEFSLSRTRVRTLQTRVGPWAKAGSQLGERGFCAVSALAGPGPQPRHSGVTVRQVLPGWSRVAALRVLLGPLDAVAVVMTMRLPVTVNGFYYVLVVPATAPLAKAPLSDVFFLVFGVIGEGRWNYSSVDALHGEMLRHFGGVLDLTRFDPTSWYWRQQRELNRLAPNRITAEEDFIILRKSDWRAKRKACYRKGAQTAIQQIQQICSKAFSEMQLRLGDGVTKRLRQLIAFHGVELPDGSKRRSYTVVAGVPFRGFTLFKRGDLIRNAMAQLQWTMSPLPGNNKQLTVHGELHDAQQTVTLSCLCADTVEQDVRDIIAAVDENVALSIQSIARGHRSTSGRRSFRVAFQSEAAAQAFLAACKDKPPTMVLENGKVRSIQVYDHSRAQESAHHGHVANVHDMVRVLVPLERRSLVRIWIDGFYGACGAMVECKLAVATATRSSNYRLFGRRGGEGKATLVNMSASIATGVAQQCRPDNFTALSLDHCAAGKLGGAASGGLWRHPGILIPSRALCYQVVGPMRTTSAGRDGAWAVVHTFMQLSHQEFITKTDAKALLKLCKELTRGAIEVSVALLGSIHDPLSIASHAPAARLLALARDLADVLVPPPGTIILNGRITHVLTSDGRLNLAYLFSPEVRFTVTTEAGVAVPFGADRVSTQPLVPGDWYFLQHHVPVDLNRVILAPPIMHSALWLYGFVHQQLSLCMAPGPVAGGAPTAGMTQAALDAYIEEIKLVCFGRGSIGGHTYLNTTAGYALYSEYLLAFGSLLPRGLHHVPRLVLASHLLRTNNDRSLLEPDDHRYLTYLLAVMVVNFVISVEIGEMARRLAGLKKNDMRTAAREYALQRTGGEGVGRVPPLRLAISDNCLALGSAGERRLSVDRPDSSAGEQPTTKRQRGQAAARAHGSVPEERHHEAGLRVQPKPRLTRFTRHLAAHGRFRPLPAWL